MDFSIMDLVKKTSPFMMARIVIYALFGLISLVFLGIMVGIGFLLIKTIGEGSIAFIFLMILAFIVIYAGFKFLEKYVLYMVKIGHVSVIVELMRAGEVPEGKSMVSYGKDQVTNNFGTSNVAFALDKMVFAAVRQIQGWIMRAGKLFDFLPGSNIIIGLVNAVMRVGLNYIDEAIMSYIFLQKSKKRGESVWKSASDGVVLYAQSWKGILKTAAGSVVLVWLFNIVLFLVLVFPLMFLSKVIAGGTSGLGFFLGFLAIVGAYLITTLIKRAFIDPIVTIAMIRSYQKSIQGLEPAMDLQQKLLGISSRFKRLFNKAKEEDTPDTPSGTGN